jgi:hypothetical protein
MTIVLFIVAGCSSQETGHQPHAGKVEWAAYSFIPLSRVNLHTYFYNE